LARFRVGAEVATISAIGQKRTLKSNMKPFSWLVVLQLASIVTMALSISRNARTARATRQFLAAARATFRRSFHGEKGSPFYLDGATAEILCEDVTGSGLDDVAVSILARTDTGEYFMFKATRGGSWLKHTPPDVARAVLGNGDAR
jgi:hypothetical protein